jgi:HAE1 family hydrophobic/amphiphilic exporter-1
MMIFFLGMVGAAYYGFITLPTGFFPEEDQGYVMISAQLPDAASFERTLDVVEELDKKLRAVKGVHNVLSVAGYSLLDGAQASNAASMWVVFDSFEERKTPDLKLNAIMARIRKVAGSIEEALVFAFTPPAVHGLGVAGGFQMQLEDKGSLGATMLEKVAEEMAYDGNAQKALTNVYTTYRAGVPQLFAQVNRTKVKNLNISLSEVFDTLQAYLGSAYVNDFNRFGRTFHVNLQAEAKYRAFRDDIGHLEVRNSDGKMIPLDTLLITEEVLGPQIIIRYNMYPSASISGSAAPGYSSGQALSIMEQMAREKLPSSMGFEWTGMSFQEKQAGNPMVIFALAIVFVYLILCAQYESWSLSFSIMLAVPLALLGTVAAVTIRHMDVNVYTQIGIVLLIALASKNAILITEFARDKREAGMGILEAAAEAARLRFRPILMTSFAFILGTFPLVVAEGAGAASRQVLGTAVFGGMIAATFLTILFVPVFFVVIQRISERLKRKGSRP